MFECTDCGARMQGTHVRGHLCPPRIVKKNPSGGGNIPINDATIRDLFAAEGAPYLPPGVDTRLWNTFLTAANKDIYTALKLYDEFMARRDYHYADALLQVRIGT